MVFDGIGLTSRAKGRQAFLGNINFDDTCRNHQIIFLKLHVHKQGHKYLAGLLAKRPHQPCQPIATKHRCDATMSWGTRITVCPNFTTFRDSRESPMRIHFYENQVHFAFHGALDVAQTSERTVGGPMCCVRLGRLPPRRIDNSFGVEAMAKLHTCFGQVWLLL